MAKPKTTTRKQKRRAQPQPPSTAPGILFFVVLGAFLSLSVVAWNDHVHREDDKNAAEILALMPPLPDLPKKVITGNRKANGYRDVGQSTAAPKVIYPKSPAERAALIAKAWSLKPGDKLAFNLR